MSINTAILIKGCRQNDVLCQEQLYKLFYPDMIKICYRYADDMDGAGIIYNNAMLKVFKGISNYNEEGRLSGWIKTVVINCSIDFCKQKTVFSKTAEFSKEEEVTIPPDVFDILAGRDIQQLIARLPKATATVFNMYVYEGFTHRQVGELLGISNNTSKWHVSEAKRILKIKLENISETEIKINAAG
ncbi:MAG: sigma-70 family RNA polymerase sigma factor [Ferruginibacter sp.]